MIIHWHPSDKKNPEGLTWYKWALAAGIENPTRYGTKLPPGSESTYAIADMVNAWLFGVDPAEYREGETK